MFAACVFLLARYSAADRVSILKALAAKVSLGSDVDLEAIGNSPKVKETINNFQFFFFHHCEPCWRYNQVLTTGIRQVTGSYRQVTHK